MHASHSLNSLKGGLYTVYRGSRGIGGVPTIAHLNFEFSFLRLRRLSVLMARATGLCIFLF